MEQIEKNGVEYYAIDMVHIAKSLLSRAWIILLAGLLTAAAGFGFASCVIEPEYSSSIMLYVNNSSFSLGNTSFSISSSEITAAQSLVKTYGEILNNRTTLERIIEKADLPYSYKQLSRKITAEPSNETEIMRVTVTTNNPYEASDIANCIAEVLPVRISEIIDGASMEVIDTAIPHLEKVAPSITLYTAVGLMLGTLLSALVLVVTAMMDDTIHNEDYILQHFSYPILAKVPNLLVTGDKNYSYYSQKHSASAEGKGDGDR